MHGQILHRIAGRKKRLFQVHVESTTAARAERDIEKQGLGKPK